MMHLLWTLTSFFVLLSFWAAPAALAQNCVANRYSKIRQYENWIDSSKEPSDLSVLKLVNIVRPYSKTEKILARHILALFETTSQSMLREYLSEVGIQPSERDIILDLYSQWRCEQSTNQVQNLAVEVGAEQQSHGDALAKSARSLMATAYNSCEVLKIREMRRSDSDLKGIEIVGQHPDVPDVDLFAITDRVEFLSSHYYYQSVLSAASAQSPMTARPAPLCSNETPASPLFYRFGGKPAAIDRRLKFTLKRSEGSGGDHLGVDCSGFVLGALYAQGARLSLNASINTDTFQLVPARKLKNPEPAGLNCLVDMTQKKSNVALTRGDLVATSWHIFMIDQVGLWKGQPDPIGFRKYGPTFECDRLKIEDLDFSVIQSSATHMIGINRMHIRDFLNSEIDEIQQMSTDLLNYGKWACANALQQKTLVQQLQPQLANVSARVVRHSSHPSCQQAPLHYEGEQCGSSCEKK